MASADQPAAASCWQPISLPSMTHCDLAATTNGDCLASTRDFVARIEPAGSVRWLIRNEPPRVGGLIALATGHLARAEGDTLTIRNDNDGSVYAAWPARGLTALVGGPEGSLFYLQHDEAQSFLISTSTAGAVNWQCQLPARPTSAPLVLDDLILVCVGPRIHAYSLAGQSTWVADRHGFHPPPRPEVPLPIAPRPGTDTTRIGGQLTAIGSDLLLTEITTANGRNFHLVDLRAATVRPITAPIALHGPATPVHSPSSPLHVALLGPTTATAATAQWTIVLANLSGHVLWTHSTSLQPRSLHSDGRGQLFAACSTSLDEWRKYRPETAGLVYCLGIDGRPQWTLPLAEPLVGSPILGSRGHLYLPTVTGLLIAAPAATPTPIGGA